MVNGVQTVWSWMISQMVLLLMNANSDAMVKSHHARPPAHKEEIARVTGHTAQKSRKIFVLSSKRLVKIHAKIMNALNVTICMYPQFQMVNGIAKRSTVTWNVTLVTRSVTENAV